MVKDTAFLALPARDLELSAGFYEEVLGLERIGEQAEGIRSVDFRTPSLVLRIYEWTAEFRRGGHTGLQFFVSSAAEGRARLIEAGAEVTEVRTEPWGGTVCTFADPDGNRLDLLQEDYPIGGHGRDGGAGI